MKSDHTPFTFAGDNVVWRFQSGSLLHLGLSAVGTVVWQKSAITGMGRLKPLRLNLVARIDTGRLLAQLDPADTPNTASFLKQAIHHADELNGAPGTIVFPRRLTREEPRLLQITEEAQIKAVFATNQFRQRQKISRHFEEFLGSQIDAHSLLAQKENLLLCLPHLVTAWNTTGQCSEEDIGRRYSAGCDAVNACLGADPVAIAKVAFQKRRLVASELRFVPGKEPEFHFTTSTGYTVPYCGYDLLFKTTVTTYRVPLFARFFHNPTNEPVPLRTFNPEIILLKKAHVPVELRSLWHSDKRQPNTAIRFVDVLDAMRARGAALQDIAGVLRSTLRAYTQPPTSLRSKFSSEATGTQPDSEIRAAGITLVNESWERIRERHFWRATAVWDAGWKEPLVFARVQIELDGRQNILRESGYNVEGTTAFMNLLCSLFLSSQDKVVPPEYRREIVLTLREKASARSRIKP